MGEAKRRGKDRIEKAKRRQAAIQNRIASFAREVGEYGVKTGLDMGAVKLDARFVILKFDDLVKFIDRLPIHESFFLPPPSERELEPGEPIPGVVNER